MREKILSMILALSMLCAFVPMTASAETYEDYLEYWVNEDNTVTISRCAKDVTEVNIPSEIQFRQVFRKLTVVLLSIHKMLRL